MLRCTLKDFKRSYQVRIPSNHLNNLRLYTTDSSKGTCSQIEDLDSCSIKPNFVTGFTDAEGSFIVRIRKNPKAKIG